MATSDIDYNALKRRAGEHLRTIAHQTSTHSISRQSFRTDSKSEELLVCLICKDEIKQEDILFTNDRELGPYQYGFATCSKHRENAKMSLLLYQASNLALPCVLNEVCITDHGTESIPHFIRFSPSFNAIAVQFYTKLTEDEDLNKYKSDEITFYRPLNDLVVKNPGIAKRILDSCTWDPRYPEFVKEVLLLELSKFL